ncbi:DMT family transporter [Luteimicrobium sp. DT211]|uniref:DMT family transporter n=1 Tax=Luteimicrobium sp. DT211 TaxID=3393412 RepID=UPI003CEE4E53
MDSTATRPGPARTPTNPASGRRSRVPVVGGAAAMVLVGSSAAVSRVLVDAPLFTAQALRYAIAAAVLVLIARVRGVPIRRPRGAEWLWLTAVAATGLVLFNVALVRGAAHAEPAVLAVAVACVPVLLGVVGPALERRRPRARLVVAAVVVTAGAVLVEGTGHADAVGIAWAVVTLVCEAGFTLLAVPVLRRHGPWGVSLHAVWIGAVLFAALAVPLEGWGAVGQLDGADLLTVAYLAVLVTAVAFVLWYGAVGALGSDRAGLLTGLAPVAAAGAGVAGGLALPGVGVWAGIAVVGVGLVLGLRAGTVDGPASPAPTRRSPCVVRSSASPRSRSAPL